MTSVNKKRLRTARALKALGLLIGLPLFYLAAGVAGSLIPANSDWREPEEGVTILVRTNGVHTWLMLPKVAEGVDWRPLADPRHIRDPRYGRGSHVAFGFGNRDFYLNTPTWADLSLSTALAAAFGRGPALMHVEHEHQPRPNEYQTTLTLRPEEYRRLAAHIRGSFVLDASGKPVPLLGRGYGPADIFYEAQGSYNAGRTCNEWTGEALRAAGVRTGIWTPFSPSIMWRLD
ncbi:MAG TPA: TIGR02117 family protein [Allosphingosinicella sp.]|uniref:TIGR02117 family protein n=1 Tax=Allosphingosinicella sp. TaxID=2823234 RepID=UPI002EDA1C33